MRQQKQFTIAEIKTGRSQKRVVTLNNESRLGYLLTSRRVAATKYMKGLRQVQNKLYEDCPQNPTHKKKSISIFKDSLMTLDESNHDRKTDKRGSQQHMKSNYNTLTYNNPQTNTTRKRFIEKHLKTEDFDEDHLRSPCDFQCLLTKKNIKPKPISVFRSKVHRLNTSIHKNSFIEDSPYITSTISPDNSKRLKSEPAVRYTSVFAKKSNFDLEGYDYVKDLGTGGYARVVLVKKLNTLKPGYFAVKIYDKEKTKQKSKVTNIPREIKIMSQIYHHNICRIQQQYENKTTHFIVMEYCGHQSLFRKIGESNLGYLPEHEAKRYFIGIIDAFMYLQNKKISHRDVKAENILVYKQQIKLIDFGFSVVPNTTNLVDSYCGTPAYMAPEIFNRSPYNPFLAQIWSLGVLLYLMLQGMYPFVTSDQDQLVQKIKRGNYKFIKPISDDAKNLIRWMISVDPSQRISLKSIKEHSWLQDTD